MSRYVIIPIAQARSRVIVNPTARGVVTSIVAPSGVAPTFYILTELGEVIDTEASDRMRTE